MTTEELEKAYNTVCPVCRRSYGLHNTVEMNTCFPALVAAVHMAKVEAYEDAAPLIERMSGILVAEFSYDGADLNGLKVYQEEVNEARHLLAAYRALKDSLVPEPVAST